MEFLAWDFFGPTSQRTAEHFLVHLQEFLKKHHLEFPKQGICSAGEGHFAAYIEGPSDELLTIISALKPQRRGPAHLGACATA